VTNDQVQAILGWADGTSEAYLTAAIPLYTEFAEAYCNADFAETSVNPLPGGVQLFVAHACAFGLQSAGVESERLGDFAVTYSTSLPAAVLAYLKPHRVVSFT